MTVSQAYVVFGIPLIALLGTALAIRSARRSADHLRSTPAAKMRAAE